MSVGQLPVLIATFLSSRPTPVAATHLDGRVFARVYFIVAGRPSEAVTLSGWRRGSPRHPVVFDNPVHAARGTVRETLPTITFRRGDLGPDDKRFGYQLSAIQAPAFGCYLIEVETAGERRLVTIDLTVEGIAAARRAVLRRARR